MGVFIKILVFLVIAVFVGLASFFMFGGMILAMNGYNESDARWGIYLFMVWALIGTLLAALAGIFLEGYLTDKKELHLALSALLAVVGAFVLGFIINLAGVFAGIILAEIVRTQF